MAIYLGDINTRARGLRTRLLPAHDMERLAHARSLFALHRELSALGLARAEAPATPASLEQAIRRRAADLMAILGRWSTDDRRPILAVVLEDEDRRSLQSILRGAEQGAGSDARMSGLVPTMDLSERALRVLAAQPTMADVVRMLVLWAHPFGRPLIDAVSGPHPSLFKAEVELQRAFAQRALAHAHRGGRALAEHARQVIDAMNASSVLLHFPERDEDIADSIFIDGGSQIDRDGFAEMMRNESFEQARRALLIRLQDSALGSAFREEAENLSTLEAAVLRAQIAEQRRLARLRPDGAAPTISFALELRAEVLDLRRIIWGVSLGAPQALMQTSMVAS